MGVNKTKQNHKQLHRPRALVINTKQKLVLSASRCCCDSSDVLMSCFGRLCLCHLLHITLTRALHGCLQSGDGGVAHQRHLQKCTLTRVSTLSMERRRHVNVATRAPCCSAVIWMEKEKEKKKKEIRKKKKKKQHSLFLDFPGICAPEVNEVWSVKTSRDGMS